MEHEDVIFVGACDLSGHMRGKAFPAVDLESRVRKGHGIHRGQHHDVGLRSDL